MFINAQLTMLEQVFGGLWQQVAILNALYNDDLLNVFSLIQRRLFDTVFSNLKNKLTQ